METKQTQPLNVYVDHKLLLGQIAVNPNDGFDLGLMKEQYEVDIHFKDAEAIPPLKGQIILKNSCPAGIVLVSAKHWEILNRESRVLLAVKDRNLYIVSLKKA